MKYIRSGAENAAVDTITNNERQTLRRKLKRLLWIVWDKERNSAFRK
jgi:hypothetical protein